jgi:hypothetical protein
MYGKPYRANDGPITKKNSTTISHRTKTSAPFLSWHMIMHGTIAWKRGDLDGKDEVLENNLKI